MPLQLKCLTTGRSCKNIHCFYTMKLPWPQFQAYPWNWIYPQFVNTTNTTLDGLDTNIRYDLKMTTWTWPHILNDHDPNLVSSSQGVFWLCCEKFFQFFFFFCVWIVADDTIIRLVSEDHLACQMIFRNQSVVIKTSKSSVDSGNLQC